jgi:hypothetical protein
MLSTQQRREHAAAEKHATRRDTVVGNALVRAQLGGDIAKRIVRQDKRAAN